eukprot:SAG11_NODE_1278_length_5317_cov_4.188386_3_plen_95_part_00
MPGEIRAPQVVELMEELGQKIQDAGKAAGTLVLTAEDYEFWRRRGFTVNVAVVQKMLLDGASRLLDECSAAETAIASPTEEIVARERHALRKKS